MHDRDVYCVKWNEDEERYEIGQHGKVDTVVLKDAYFCAPDISRHMPDGQYVNERDVEKVDFTVDISGDEITEDDVSSRSSSYLQKFPNVYTGVAGFVSNLERIPVGRFECSHCNNNVEFKENIEKFS